MTRRIVHVITGLPVGGAQMMLCKLLSRMDRSEFEPEVVSLLDRGPMTEPIERLGIRVRALGMSPNAAAPLAVFRLARWLRAEPAHIIQCWMYHADLVGGLAGRLAGIRRTIWGIRQSTVEPRGTRRSTLWTAKTCARLSRFVPVRIVCCSEAALRGHVALGYDRDRMVVIPNGFDVDSFRPEPSCRGAVREDLGIPESALLVGLVARFHPQKDHRTFLDAAAIVARRVADAHFLLCGDGVEPRNPVFAAKIAENGLAGRIHLLGERRDLPRLTAALDVACSSSFAEGFPNAIGEAMSCAVPCVVTDVGDAAELVGGTGRVVPAENPAALAEAVAGSRAHGTRRARAHPRSVLARRRRRTLPERLSRGALGVTIVRLRAGEGLA